MIINDNKMNELQERSDDTKICYTTNNKIYNTYCYL